MLWRILVSGLLLVGFAVPAHAAEPATFGVRPATAEAPDSRNNFSYSATPGAVVRDFVAVSNVSAQPLKLRVYASDAFNTPEGGFDLLPSGRESADVGKWVIADRPEVEVAPRSTVIVPFALTVPANATPGDHTGGIVASLTTSATGSDGQRVAVEQRVGARVYLRVSGDLTPRLSIEGLTASYRGQWFGSGAVALSYVVRNTGNVRLGGKQRMWVETPWGSVVDGPAVADLPELLPGSTFRVSAVVDGVLPAGWVDGVAHIEPVAPAGTAPLPGVAEARTTTAAPPWVVVIAFGFIALVLVLLTLRRRRSKPSPVTPAREVERVGA
ncbi:DUF916 domain-containing protein [Lentzea sp. BCCO 10_0856]|uniref:DUF916 domain-containing protein n=1 Tax=Lentzea miocenica TaxID=3095431 RepID=A0ABU4T1C0_9PSEU|nr:DUF916 domain-containing protein [Lentzea sp. BCCO 10_0856]MDX8031954.1 DUF916 domain-containing protein [Lentzea sp. BCCO 10_0856]